MSRVQFVILSCLKGLIKCKYDPNPELFHLPPLNVNPDTVTVSGFSSGAYMANQIFVILSETFAGVSSLSGGAFTTSLYYDELNMPGLSKEGQE